MVIKDKIQNYIDIAKKFSDRYLVIVLGNVKGITTNYADFNNGTSVESEYYSLNQFNLIVNNLQKNNIETICYYDEMDFIYDFLNRRIRNNYTKKFIVLNFAQKGIVQGRKSLIPVFCEMNGILHTNSNGFASSFAREKFYWNLCLKSIVPTPDSWLYNKHGWVLNCPPKGLKVIAKLPNQASSIGLDSDESIFAYSEDQDAYIKELSIRYNDSVIVQEFIYGKEAEVPVFYNGQDCFALPPAGILIDDEENLGNRFLNYQMRGNQGFKRYNLEQKNPALSNLLKSNTVKIAKFMDLQGICRIDYRINENGQPYVTDINCNPHLTATSCIAKSMGYLGFDNYEDTILALIGITISRHPN